MPRDALFHRASDRPFGALSNFYAPLPCGPLAMGSAASCFGAPSEIANCVLFDSAEHAFQAMKFTPTGSGIVRDTKNRMEFVFDPETMDNASVQAVRNAPTPADARALGRMSPDVGDSDDDNNNNNNNNKGDSASIVDVSADSKSDVLPAMRPIRADWDDIRLAVMLTVLRAKFSLSAEKINPLRDLLMSTGNRRIVEQTSDRDLFWGNGGGKGENHLGRLLMRVRGEIRRGASAAGVEGGRTAESHGRTDADVDTYTRKPNRCGKGTQRQTQKNQNAVSRPENASDPASRGKVLLSQSGKEALPQGCHQVFDYFVVLDFEATCERNEQIEQEIIEFPSVLVNARTLEVEDSIDLFVKPVERLSVFCTELTGITQEQVDKGLDFPDALAEYVNWLRESISKASDRQSSTNDSRSPDAAAGGGSSKMGSFCFVTCGNWDLRTMLPKQLSKQAENTMCLAKQVPEFSRWCNLKREFARFFKKARAQGTLPGSRREQKPSNRFLPGMSEMLQELGLELEGRHHSGIDDCHNIGKILVDMCRRGCVIRTTSSI